MVQKKLNKQDDDLIFEKDLGLAASKTAINIKILNISDLKERKITEDNVAKGYFLTVEILDDIIVKKPKIDEEGNQVTVHVEEANVDVPVLVDHEIKAPSKTIFFVEQKALTDEGEIIFRNGNEKGEYSSKFGALINAIYEKINKQPITGEYFDFSIDFKEDIKDKFDSSNEVFKFKIRALEQKYLKTIYYVFRVVSEV